MAEDEWIIRETAATMLTEAGFIVIEAADGAGALAAIAQRPSEVHALFTDVRMPGPIDGLELARRARALVPNLAILIASGRAVPGADELPPGSQFLSKPYSAREIPRHVQLLLGHPLGQGKDGRSVHPHLRLPAIRTIGLS